MDNLLLTPVTSEILLNILPYLYEESEGDRDKMENLHQFHILLIQSDEDYCFVCVFKDRGPGSSKNPDVIPVGITSTPVDDENEGESKDFFDRAWLGTARFVGHLMLIDSLDQICMEKNPLGVIDIQKTGEVAFDHFIGDRCVIIDSLFGHDAFVSKVSWPTYI